MTHPTKPRNGTRPETIHRELLDHSRRCSSCDMAYNYPGLGWPPCGIGNVLEAKLKSQLTTRQPEKLQ
jgi:hypothetical protein